MNKGRPFGHCFGWNDKVHIFKLLPLVSSAIRTPKSSRSRSGFHSSAVIRHGKRSSMEHRLMDHISKINNLDDAMGFYHEMVCMRPLPRAMIFNQLLSLVVRMKKHSAAISLFGNMRVKGIPVSDSLLNIIINCFCMEGRVDFGFSLMGAFYKRGLVPNARTFGTLLKGLFRVDRVSDAQELFRKILHQKLCQPNGVMMGTVIDGLSKAGNTELAVRLLTIMKNSDTKPDVIMYSTIIDCLCKDNMVNKALGLLGEMIEEGISPNVFTYSSLIRGFCNLENWNEVKRLWTQMLSFDIAPNVVTYTILIDSFSKHGLMTDANDVFETMIQRGETPDIITYNTLIDGYCLQGKMDEAIRVFDAMVANGIDPSIVSYDILIHGHFRKRKFQEAMQTFQDMLSKGFNPAIATYNILLKGLFQSGRCDMANGMFKEIALKPDYHTYCVMLNGLCKNGLVNEGLLLLEKMEKDGVEVYVTMYNIILDGLCKSGRLDKAREIFSSLSLKGISPDVKTYSTIMDALCKLNLVEEAKELFVQMEANGCLANEFTYNIIVQGLLEGRKYDDAVAYLDKMVEREFGLHSSNMSRVLELILKKENAPAPIQKMMQKLENAKAANVNKLGLRNSSALNCRSLKGFKGYE